MKLNKNLPLHFVALTVLICVVSSNSLQFRDDRKKMAETTFIKKYFPHETNLCVVLSEDDKDEFWPTFHVPVVVYTQEHVLQDCRKTLKDQDGYAFMTSNATNLKKQIVPLLKCFNQTTLRLNTKYILVVDLSKHNTSSYHEIYSDFFHNLWKAFRIINIAILPVENQSTATEPPVIFSYNPFLARHSSSLRALRRHGLDEDIRGIMTDRFRNMHGHGVNTVLYRYPDQYNTVESLKKKRTGANPPLVLFKQCLEESLNATFNAYEASYDIISGTNINVHKVVGEFISGRSEFCVDFPYSIPGVMRHKQIQEMTSGLIYAIYFVVSKPKHIESWRIFQYIFQWQVCVGLGMILFLLSGAALLFVYVHSKLNSHMSYCKTCEIVSVWKAALSISVTRLPTTHSQRILIGCSLLLGLIFLTLFSTQMFALVKSKPRLASIKTLQDLHDSNLPIYTTNVHVAQYLNIFKNTTLHNLKDNLKPGCINRTEKIFNPIYLNKSDGAVVYSQLGLDVLASRSAYKERFKLFEVLKEPLFQSLFVAYLPIGSVYFDHFNNVNQRLISGGFYPKWYKEFKNHIVEDSATTGTPTPSVLDSSNQPEADGGPVPLTYEDLRLAFYILYIGLTLSTLCFLVEVCSC